MLGLLVRLVLFGVLVYFIYRLVRNAVRKAKDGMFGGAAPFNRSESCPSCQAMIRVPEEPGACPRCHTVLGRSPDGKLLIKVN